jgi:hypothetical protein
MVLQTQKMHTGELSQKQMSDCLMIILKHLTSSSKLKQYISHFDIVQTGTKIQNIGIQRNN